MITEKDIQKLKGAFATADDHVNMENKVDKLTELVGKLPTRDDIQALLERTYNLTLLQTEHNRMKKIISERLKVEV